MKLVLQGMRRSGTTIVFDALDQDPELTSWYEPLAAARRPAIGGGSRAQSRDLFASLRTARTAFTREYGVTDSSVLNYGAPRDPALEFTSELSPVIGAYLQFLFNRPGAVMAKFTRLACKSAVIAELLPDAFFGHLLRDPRAVAVSYLFGKNQRNRHRFPTGDPFFERRTNYTAWSSRRFSELVLQQPGYQLDHVSGDPDDPHALYDFERILLLWRFTFEQVWQQAKAAFGDRYIMLRHEDFTADPAAELTSLYARAGRELPARVSKWAATHVKAPNPQFAADDSRWAEAFDRLGMTESVAQAGYAAVTR